MTNKVSGFWLLPTYGCNNRCRWCYVGGKLTKKAEASLDSVKKYLRQMVDAGAKNCIFIGGEPTVYPHIIDAIKFATEYGLNVRMMSNGRKLSDRDFVKSLKAAGLKHCSISIEGIGHTHDEITGVKGSFVESLQGILNCQEEGIPNNTISTVGQTNKREIEEMVLFFQGLNIKRSVFNMCSSQPSGYEGEENGTIELDEYARIIEDIGLKYESVKFYALVPLCLFNQEKLHRLLELGRISVSCSLFANTIAIDPNGNINPCTHMADVIYGNLNEPKGLEQSLEAKQKEKELFSSHAPSEKCVKCPLWNTCHGGCNLIWFSRKASDFIKGIS